MSAANEQARGSLVVISGPSGSGKTTIVDRLLEDSRCVLSVSSTTRSMRPGEVEGREYHYLEQDEFQARVDAGAFLEWARVYGNCYGTERATIERELAKGRTVLLNIDTQGAATLKSKGVEALFLFLLPPSLEVLEQRLRRRGTDAEDVIRTRLSRARAELAEADRFDVRITNDELDEAVTAAQAASFG
jgi:guanylate kinase